MNAENIAQPREADTALATAPPRAVAAPMRRPLAALIDRENARHARRRTIWWGAAFALPVVVALGWWLMQPAEVPFAARFRVEAVAFGDLVREVRATGNAEAVTTIEVGAEISGRIASVEVDYNSDVVAGQVLARFDRAALEAQLAQFEAAEASARASLEQAKTDRERAVRDLGRAERLHRQNNISEAAYDDAVTALRLAEQRVTAAEAALSAQAAAVKLARTNLDHTLIVSPIDGTVITRNVDSGQTVASSLASPVLFTVAADLRKMRVIAAVDEADVSDVSVGQSASFSVDAYPDRVFIGTVTQVRHAATVVQDVVTYGVVIEFENADLALKPGMTAAVRIRTAAVPAVLSVPNTALAFVPPATAAPADKGVWLVEGETLRHVSVATGMSDGEWTEIEPGVLEQGANVVVDLSPEGRAFYGNGG